MAQLAMVMKARGTVRDPEGNKQEIVRRKKKNEDHQRSYSIIRDKNTSATTMK